MFDYSYALVFGAIFGIIFGAVFGYLIGGHFQKGKRKTL